MFLSIFIHSIFPLYFKSFSIFIPFDFMFTCIYCLSFDFITYHYKFVQNFNSIIIVNFCLILFDFIFCYFCFVFIISMSKFHYFHWHLLMVINYSFVFILTLEVFRIIFICSMKQFIHF